MPSAVPEQEPPTVSCLVAQHPPCSVHVNVAVQAVDLDKSQPAVHRGRRVVDWLQMPQRSAGVAARWISHDDTGHTD